MFLYLFPCIQKNSCIIIAYTFFVRTAQILVFFLITNSDLSHSNFQVAAFTALRASSGLTKNLSILGYRFKVQSCEMGTYFIKEIAKLKLNILWAEIVRVCFVKSHFLIQGNILFEVLFNVWNVFFCSIFMFVTNVSKYLSLSLVIYK